MRRCHIDELLCEVEHFPWLLSLQLFVVLCRALVLTLRRSTLLFFNSSVCMTRWYVTLNTGWLELMPDSVRDVWECLRSMCDNVCVNVLCFSIAHTDTGNVPSTKCNTILIYTRKINSTWTMITNDNDTDLFDSFLRCVPFSKWLFDDFQFRRSILEPEIYGSFDGWMDWGKCMNISI